jgi:hypothetical protein
MLIVRGRLAQLLRHPGVGRVARHADMDDAARAQLHEEVGEQRAEERVGHLQEVARPDVAGVVAQERRPRLSFRAGPWYLAQVFLHRPLADADVEFEQLAPDALGAPERIVARHLLDEIDGRRRQRRGAGAWCRVLAVYFIRHEFLAVRARECQSLRADGLNGQHRHRADPLRAGQARHRRGQAHHPGLPA